MTLLRSMTKVWPFFQTAFFEGEWRVVLTIDKVENTGGLLKTELNSTDLCGCR